MCRIYDCFDCIKICIVHARSAIHHPSGALSIIAQETEYDRTNVAPKVRSLEYFDTQILLHFPHDLDSVVE